MSNCGDRISTARGLLESIERSHDSEIAELKSALELVLRSWLDNTDPKTMPNLCDKARELLGYGD
jgi:hypothetical protein